MADIGVDVGSRYMKAVLVNVGAVTASSVVEIGADLEEAWQKAHASLLEKAGISGSDIGSVVSTGAGKDGLYATNHSVPEIICAGLGSVALKPGARLTIDLGAEHCRVIRCDAHGNPVQFAYNDKCAAGVGAFLDIIAKALGISQEDVGKIALRSEKTAAVNTTCAVFAESEVISLVHRGVPKEEILRAVVMAIASRTAALAKRIGLQEQTCLIGGMARNEALVKFLEQELGRSLYVPENPELVTAMGAVLCLRQRIGPAQLASEPAN